MQRREWSYQRKYIAYRCCRDSVPGGTTYLIRTDHIDRPAFATDATGAVVSSLSYEPFGAVHESAGLDTGLRFPGQVHHWETDLHQNWMHGAF